MECGVRRTRGHPSYHQSLVLWSLDTGMCATTQHARVWCTPPLHRYPELRLRKKRRCCGWKRSGWEVTGDRKIAAATPWWYKQRLQRGKPVFRDDFSFQKSVSSASERTCTMLPYCCRPTRTKLRGVGCAHSALARTRYSCNLLRWRDRC
jgi:hypothetical protein